MRDCLLGLDSRPEVKYNVELAQEGYRPPMRMRLPWPRLAFRQPFVAPLDWVDASQVIHEGTAVNLPAAVAGNKKQEETRWVPIEASAKSSMAPPEGHPKRVLQGHSSQPQVERFTCQACWTALQTSWASHASPSTVRACGPNHTHLAQRTPCPSARRLTCAIGRPDISDCGGSHSARGPKKAGALKCKAS